MKRSMKIMMADGKEVSTASETPTYIVTSSPEQNNGVKKGGITRKHVLIAVSAVLIVAIILVAILVGMHMFSQAQKDIVKFSLQFKGTNGDNVKQDVESDPNDNVVVFHLTRADQDAYVVNDFNKGMQIMKISSSEGVSCYVTALNRTHAMNPSLITGSDSMTGKNGSVQESFLVSPDPVTDRSFLTKKAQDLCSGVSVYWVTRHCGEEVADNTTDIGNRNKRAIATMTRYHGLPGLGSCCRAYWACQVSVVQRISGSVRTCTFVARAGTCCGAVARPYCNNVYYGSGPCI